MNDFSWQVLQIKGHGLNMIFELIDCVRKWGNLDTG